MRRLSCWSDLPEDRESTDRWATPRDWRQPRPGCIGGERHGDPAVGAGEGEVVHATTSRCYRPNFASDGRVETDRRQAARCDTGSTRLDQCSCCPGGTEKHRRSCSAEYKEPATPHWAACRSFLDFSSGSHVCVSLHPVRICPPMAKNVCAHGSVPPAKSSIRAPLLSCTPIRPPPV